MSACRKHGTDGIRIPATENTILNEIGLPNQDGKWEMQSRDVSE
jgi:hypothetical protein